MVDSSAPLKSRAIISNEGKKHWLNFEYRREGCLIFAIHVKKWTLCKCCEVAF